MTAFSYLVATSDEVASTSKRTEKVAALAGLLRRLDHGEVATAVAMLTGAPRQGRIGVGWRTISGLAVTPAAEPSLSLTEVDDALTASTACAGAGSAGERNRILTSLLDRPPSPLRSRSATARLA